MVFGGSTKSPIEPFNACPGPFYSTSWHALHEHLARRLLRDYWKSGEKSKEVEVLDASEGREITDGIIEDENEDDQGSPPGGGKTVKRWTRIVRCAVGISQAVDGFKWIEGTRDWRIGSALHQKVQKWKDEDRVKQEAEEKWRRGTRWADDDATEDLSESDDDEADSAEVKALKVISYLFLLSLN